MYYFSILKLKTLMKTKRVLLSTMVILLAFGWQVPFNAQDIPVNYTQNPNMEHDLNSIFWYGGWDADYGSDGIASFPSAYLTDTESHSGSWSLHFFAQWHYIWISYPVRGQEQKKMKNSFWYKGTIQYFNNYIYRDVRMTENDLPPALAEYVGADSVWHQYPDQDAIRFEFLQDEPDGYTEDWTYFEFVWDMPGTIKGILNTTMWYADVPDGYVDDIYYGEWYDGQYSGEEPFGFVNGDFELEGLNTEWLVNVFPGGLVESSDFLSWTENHTDAGLQSLRLQDYLEVSIDTADAAMPYDSISIDTSMANRNVTYYLPALGAEGKDMELSFWYKGNDARLGIEFYDDYGVTTSEFPLPAGARLVSDSANPVIVLDTENPHIDTLDSFIDTFMVADLGDYTEVLELQIDTMAVKADTILAQQNFDDPANLMLPNDAWVWSGSDNWGWNDWAAATKDDEAWSDPEALWLPGDPGWGGAEGYVSVVDDSSYIWEFMYKGDVQFILMLGDSTKYDLLGDPDGIVPVDPMIDSVTADAIYWTLRSDYWKRFRYEYKQGSWLADSSVTSPATVTFDLIGTYDAADLGYVDDIMIAMGSPMDPVVDTNYVVRDAQYTIETTYDTLSIDYNDKMAVWDLPAAADWTEWKLNWTNPTTDIGGTLTLLLDNDATDTPDILVPLEKEEFNDDHAGWTYFDDFVYSESTGWINRDLVKYDLHTYPNPAQDVLYLSIEDPLSRIEVYNSLGQLQMDLNSPERVMDISGLESGIFFLNVTDEEGIIHKTKFVKQ